MRRRPYALMKYLVSAASCPVAVGHELGPARIHGRTCSQQHREARHQDQFNRDNARGFRYGYAHMARLER